MCVLVPYKNKIDIWKSEWNTTEGFFTKIQYEMIWYPNFKVHIPVTFQYAKDRRILGSQNTTVYMY